MYVVIFSSIIDIPLYLRPAMEKKVLQMNQEISFLCSVSASVSLKYHVIK
jgi:hypothetical protein